MARMINDVNISKLAEKFKQDYVFSINDKNEIMGTCIIDRGGTKLTTIYELGKILYRSVLIKSVMENEFGYMLLDKLSELCADCLYTENEKSDVMKEICNHKVANDVQYTYEDLIISNGEIFKCFEINGYFSDNTKETFCTSFSSFSVYTEAINKDSGVTIKIYINNSAFGIGIGSVSLKQLEEIDKIFISIFENKVLSSLKQISSGYLMANLVTNIMFYKNHNAIWTTIYDNSICVTNAICNIGSIDNKDIYEKYINIFKLYFDNADSYSMSVSTDKFIIIKIELNKSFISLSYSYNDSTNLNLEMYIKDEVFSIVEKHLNNLNKSYNIESI